MESHTPRDSSSVKSALGNELILDTIFKHLSISELLRIRKVCRKWNECSVPAMKKFRNQLKSVKMTRLITNSGYVEDGSTIEFDDKEICKIESKFQKFCENWATTSMEKFEDIVPTKFTIPDYYFSPKYLASNEGVHAMRFYLEFCPIILKKLTILIENPGIQLAPKTIPKYLQDILLQKTNILFPALQSLDFQFRSQFDDESILTFNSKSSKKGQKYENFQFVQNVEFDEIQMLRCLKSLTIFKEDQFFLQWESLFFQELRKIAPNLIKISFPAFIDYDDNNQEIREFPNFPIYKFLTFSQGEICHFTNLKFKSVNEQIVQKLLDLTKLNQMKMKKFTINYEHYSDKSYLEELLQIQRENIEELEIRKLQTPPHVYDEEEVEVDPNHRLRKIDYKMPKLKKMTISSHKALARLKFDEMNENFPSLETLNFFYFKRDSLDYQKPNQNIFFWNQLLSLKNGPPLFSVKELRILNHVIGRNSLKTLSNIFPSVNCVTLSIAQVDVEEILPVVWSLWTQTLEKLTLILVYESREKLNRLFIGDKGDMSIKNLKALTHLTIVGDFYLNSKKTCSLFLKMKNLEKICYIQNSPYEHEPDYYRSRMFSEKCHGSLKKKNIHCTYYKMGDAAVEKLFLP